MLKETFSLNHLSFRFPDDQKATLKGISFSISKGEKVVISGPSGCGKSTLLYLLNRLYPDNCDGSVDGEVLLFGKPATDYAPGEINHRVATVFQDPDSQFCMPTVEDELAFTLENLQIPFDKMEARITAVLELTGLTHLRHTIIQSLSGGTKQRVATACALIMEPEVLLLDEPLSHLDPYTAKQFVEWLTDLQLKTQLTIVAVEHRLDSWGKFFEREIQLDENGCLVNDHLFSPKQPILFPERSISLQPKTALQVENLSVTIKNKQLLTPLSFSVCRGEIVVVAGPNGSGKSTLVKSLCDIYKPTTGTIQSDGTGYVPQSPEYLFLTQTVQKEVAYSGSSNPTDIASLMTRLRLDEICEDHPFAISHGQKRRVAIAAMLADKRPVLLMDEPTSGQDKAALLELFELIDQRSKEGTTFLIVTHDMEFAASIADSVLLIKDGELTGKFDAKDVWNNEELLESHHLLTPKGVDRFAESFA
ncbi:ABC transporter related protein [Planococcus donghaensis MPA1U2]|uniref:ABC transporter related protein n=1 Tax=Planococcus donghaensis MPA1U2 TaxID=933115 RepID=E7RD42_9BACL|nr:ABC transporter ATP-binding protein [Planococcus donghaensis]EGA91106.1 ABC transporter related protein [Planococcus donghaensis MPA1U2]